jgi:CRP-like cAMP-binding protein
VLLAAAANKLAASARMTWIIIGAMFAECVPLWAAVYVGSIPPAIVLQIVAGAGMVIVDVLAFTALQRDLPREVLGRVLGSVEMLLLGTGILTSFAASAVISQAGIGWALGMLGLGFPVLSLFGIPVLRRIDAEGLVLVLRSRTALLEQVELFSAAPQAVLEQLVKGATEETVTAGTVIMRQGEEADAIYVLEEGALTVLAAAGDRPAVEVGRIEAPGYVGELGVLHGRPRSATVEAATDCKLMRIAADDFRIALQQGQPSAMLLGVAGTRFIRTTMAAEESANLDLFPAG